MTTNDVFLQIKHMFNIDDSYKSSFIHWIKMFSRPIDKNERYYMVSDFISWMEATLFISISDFNRKRIISALDSCIVYVDSKKDTRSIVINRASKELSSDKKYLQEVAEEVCKDSVISVDDLKSRCQRQDIVKMKIRFIKEVLTRYRYSDQEVADFLNVHRTTVIYHRNEGVVKAKKRRYQRMRSS